MLDNHLRRLFEVYTERACIIEAHSTRTRYGDAGAILMHERGRVLIAAGEQRLQQHGAADVRTLHRHGGVVDTILEREGDARVVVIGKRGAGHEFAADHIGSKIERVVRASDTPVLNASKNMEQPRAVVLAYDASKAADRALERLRNSRLFTGLPVHIIMADSEDAAHRQALDGAAEQLQDSRDVRTTLQNGKPQTVIAGIVAQTPGALLMMGAYGHSLLRTLIVGSTTTAMIRIVDAPVLMVR